MFTKINKNIKPIFDTLNKRLKPDYRLATMNFGDFLRESSDNPKLVFRNVFQLFSDMIHYYVEEEDEYASDPQNINYKTINCDKLLVKGAVTPFFADLPLANRIVKLADSFKEGAQQNKVYVFIGPPGSGKSTFLNNILSRFEEFTHTQEGAFYETLWRLDENKFGVKLSDELKTVLREHYKLPKHAAKQGPILEVPCPSHDHPILMIPLEMRSELLEQLVSGEAKIKLFNKKEYSWVFTKKSCTICSSLFDAILSRVGSAADVFNMIYAKRFYYDRRLANGISVYNPGDRDPKNSVNTNDVLQNELSMRFKDSNIVKYVFSNYAKTNNGVYAIMDVKGYNEKRFMDLHGIISEGLHKVDDIEENVNSLFIAVMNPEDKVKIEKQESFKDRIREICVNYILNYNEEAKIYFHSFGSQIKKRFLPGVLNNFAKIIISSRLNTKSDAMREWITEPDKYAQYCDENLLLLKLSIYNNKIPNWLDEDDLRRFDKNLRKKIIGESETEGRKGFSGRESINIFNDFYNSVRKKTLETNGGSKRKLLITMEDIRRYFKKHDALYNRIPEGFLDSIIRLYDYNLLQQIKECLFHKNEERISKDIQNYLFASNYDMEQKLLCPYTDEYVEVTDSFFNSIEHNLFTKEVNDKEREKFRRETAAEFTTSLQEMSVNDKSITSTKIYRELYNTYIQNLRRNIFQPFLEYTSFENAIKEFGTPKFQVYDNRTKDQVSFLVKNLIGKFRYTEEGAKQMCLYVLNNKVAERFTE